MVAWRAGAVLCVTGAALALVSLVLPWSNAMPQEEWSPPVQLPRYLSELPPAQSWGAVLLLAAVGAGATFCLARGRRMPPAAQLAFVLIAAAAAAAWLFGVLEVLLRTGKVQLDVVVGASGVSTGYVLYTTGLGLLLLGVAVSGADPVPIRPGTRPWRVAGHRILVAVAVICVVPALSMPWYGIDVFYPDPDGPTELDVDAWRLVFLAAVLIALSMAGAAAWRPAVVRVFRLIGLTAAVAALVFLVMGHEWLLAHEPATAGYVKLPPESGLRGGLGASAVLVLAFLLLPPGPARRRSASNPAGSAAAQT
ncbi:hypothetical protein Aph02nite_22680 [Actinoplanes philippinensis]|uniref:Uncharacterized protein n=1 Tax=Actinoplanes philippinensis TaxID=35752 RepID=A0A1I2N3V8_9ACTN|nr:hypothetical protein [Actinoplanes philippinensis]GIE76318.1 hypothetical protein Aph02nite_22680 [Actinoplanes philippinensis]SFF98452.1 hypothetical protein SAMN05421541_13832 [Actinoplanes philippinensis]